MKVQTSYDQEMMTQKQIYAT
jgi:hypothetical protein